MLVKNNQKWSFKALAIITGVFLVGSITLNCFMSTFNILNVSGSLISVFFNNIQELERWTNFLVAMMLTVIVLVVFSRVEISFTTQQPKKISSNHVVLFLELLLLLISVVIMVNQTWFPLLFTKTTSLQNNTLVFPEPKQLIEVKIDTLGKALPGTKSEGDLPVIARIQVDDQQFNTYATIKIQGTSTQSWPKKNWTIKLYQDEERKKDIYLKIGDSLPTNKWVAKADWIDPSLLRNILAYNLWGQIVDSRTTFPKNEVEQLNAENFGGRGYPLTYPTRIAINDQFYGLAVLLDAHDPKNFNIDKTNPQHLFMDFDARRMGDNSKDWANFSFKNEDGSLRCLENYLSKEGDFNEQQTEAIVRLGEFINSPLTEFKQDFHKHLDLQNIIDMLIMIEAIADWDAVAQDLEIVSYDLEKWYFLPWDKDTAFSMGWKGDNLMEEYNGKIVVSDTSKPKEQIAFWLKVYQAFPEEIEARYAKLRQQEILSVVNLKEQAKVVYEKIPAKAWKQEDQKWQEQKGLSRQEGGLNQILDWYEDRLKVLDQHFKYIDNK